eukprot:PhF_6_TR42153/c0_g1_i1/m.63701/K13806/DAGL; sn1-specific diacylglycerol lipase
MPALQLFGRKWLLSTDDFVLFPSLYAALRLAICIYLMTSFPSFFSYPVPVCNELHTFAGFSFGIYGLLFLTHVIMSMSSAQGAVFQISTRQYIVPIVLYVSFLLWLCEFANAVYGSVLMYGTNPIPADCTESNVSACRVSIITSWTLLGFHAFILLMSFDVNGRSDMRFAWRQSVAYVEQWERRIRMMFCCASPGKGRKAEIYTDIAKLFANMFRNVDLVPSDVAAGMALLREEDKKLDIQKSSLTKSRTMSVRRMSSSLNQTSIFGRQKIKHSRQFTADSIPEPDPTDRQNLLMLKHYSTYMIAIYGWPMMLLTYPGSFWWKMFPWYFSNRRAIDVWLKERPHAEVLYHCDENKGMILPFFVLWDHESHQVVISIRGTLSLNDVLADIWAEALPIEVPSIPNAMVHKGMYECATVIRDRIAQQNILRDAFTKCPTYGLVVCGHSLGAGVATMLGILYRQQEFPNVKVLSYSPPGATCSQELAAYCEEFCVSLVVGKDIVGRLSEVAMETFRNDLVRVLSTTRRTKASILFCPCVKTEVGVDVDSTESDKIYERFMEMKLCDEREVRVSMYPPARLYHMMKTHSESTFTDSVSHYVPVQCPFDVFEKIVVSPIMVRDHMPYYVKEVLERTLDELSRGDLDGFFSERSHSQTVTGSVMLPGPPNDLEKVLISEEAPAPKRRLSL